MIAPLGRWYDRLALRVSSIERWRAVTWVLLSIGALIVLWIASLINPTMFLVILVALAVAGFVALALLSWPEYAVLLVFVVAIFIALYSLGSPTRGSPGDAWSSVSNAPP